MAVTLLQTRNAVRQRADMSGSAGPDQFVSDDELNGYINASLAEFNDLVVGKNVDNYLTSTIFTVAAGANTYALSSSFYKLAGVDRLMDGQNPYLYNATWHDVNKFQFKDRNYGNNAFAPLWAPPAVRYRIVGDSLIFNPPANAQGTYRIWWYPKAPVLTADNMTYDDTQYWWEYIVIDGAIKCLQKEESDVSVLMAQKAAMMARIDAMSADRDYGNPEQVGSRRRDGWWGGNGDGGWGVGF